MKKLIFFFALSFLFIPKAFAVTPSECFSACLNKGRSPTECSEECKFNTGQEGTWQQIFGNIVPPQNVAAYSADTAGLIRLLSNVLKISVVAAGVFGLINLVTSGIQWAGAAGNPEIIKQASSRIWMSLLGLIIVAGAFVLAGVIGLLFFGSATAIINPVVFGPAKQ